MNTYYSNLIEGHSTQLRDIERALIGELDEDEGKRNLQLEARAHVQVQAQIDQMAMANQLPNPMSKKFIQWLHQEFYRDAPSEFLRLQGANRKIVMEPGEWRSRPEHDVAVGAHVPPSSPYVATFMDYFESTFTRELNGGRTARTIALAVSHHRFNYIHPFPDGNGRVSRLMSHAVAQTIGIGAHGLWSVSRGLARGRQSRSEYKVLMAHGDMPRQGDLDGRGNLSQSALNEFVEWFLTICLDQITFMTKLFDLEGLRIRLRSYVEQSATLAPSATALLEEALIRGQFERGEISRITGLPERSARRLLKDVINSGLLGSESPRGPVSLRFPADSVEDLFPRLFSKL